MSLKSDEIKLESRNTLKKIGYFACLFIGMAIGLITVPAYRIVTGITVGRTLQTLSNNNMHKAALYKKHNLADINFIVTVDGNTVYTSSDLIPYPDGLYRETLVWDETGRIVALELMGVHIFAYDTEEKRELKPGELNQYKLKPVLSDGNYAPIKSITEIGSIIGAVINK